MKQDRQPIPIEEFETEPTRIFKPDRVPNFGKVYSWKDVACLQIAGRTTEEVGLGKVYLFTDVPQLDDGGLPLASGLQRVFIIGNKETRTDHGRIADDLIAFRETAEIELQPSELLPALHAHAKEQAEAIVTERRSKQFPRRLISRLRGS